MKKILLIDDDKFLVRVYRAKFAEAGYEVKMLEEGSSAVKTAEEMQPNLIVTDLVMPGMDGFDVIVGLKSNEKTKDIPIMVLSNLKMDEDIKKAKDLGAAKYVVKSDVTFAEVLLAIGELINSPAKITQLNQ